MNETNKYSGSSSPGDSWAHEFYNPKTTMFGGRISSDATVISTAAASGSNIPITHGSSVTNTTTTHQHFNLASDQGAGGGGGGGGRVSKPVRRRSRASRRTPTTLLNTDTTNFRAMVQQFTGGPATPFASTAGGSQYRSLPGGPNFNFGVETRNQIVNPASSSGPFYNLQFQQQQQQQQQQEQYYHHHHNQQQQPPPPYMFSFMNNSRADMEDMNNQAAAVAAAAGGFSMDHVPLPLHPRPPS